MEYEYCSNEGFADFASGCVLFLDNLVPVLKPTSIIAVCSDKKQKIKNNKYRRLEKIKWVKENLKFYVFVNL